METCNISVAAIGEFDEFKSYYVVWKLQASFSSASFEPGFKSYYVVWKRVRGGSAYRADDTFKSYYVVWKLDTAFELVSHHCV